MKKSVSEIIKQKGYSAEIIPKLKLKEDLGLDSLDIVELIVELEEQYNIEIDESDLDPAKLQTLGQVHDLVEKYTRK